MSFFTRHSLYILKAVLLCSLVECWCLDSSFPQVHCWALSRSGGRGIILNDVVENVVNGSKQHSGIE